MNPDSKESTIKPVQRDDDAACGKLWEIYADEAKEYDEGLVKSWKEDMDGVLIFSGLYSAVLTAFVIESYKDLEEDPLDVSAEVLKAIYLQQTSPSNAPNLPQPWDDSFTPDPSTLACNYLWFFSLALALICAFLAMFIQQWSRHFTQRISIVRSPTTRARLIQFFYFGLKEHGMHILVDVVPSLLHVSLFCFFGGLAAFLWTVHRPLALLVLALLALLVSVYAVITLLPIIKLSSPYQTPLSSLVWRMLQTCLTMFRRLKQWGRPPSPEPKDVEKGDSSTHSPAGDALASEHGEEADSTDNLTLHQAMVNHGRRRRQDQEAQSIAWTLKYLSEDDEILPLIEALPAALAQNNQGLHNLDIIIPVLKTTIPYCNLLTRVHSLLIGAEDPWHTQAYRERCRSSVSSFLWTLSRALFSFRHQSRSPGQVQFTDAGSIIFPQEIFSALQAQSLSTKPERNHALSIMVLCMLHNCLSLDKTSSKGTGQLRELIETGDIIFRKYSHKNESGLLDVGWCIKLAPANPDLTRDNIASHFLWTYLQVSGIHFPAGFVDVCDIFRQNGIKPMHPDQGIGDGLLANLAFQLYLLDKAPQPQVTLRELDSIFTVVLQYSGVKDLPGISAYISRRAQCGPWTTAAWREEDFVHICTLLTQLPSPVYMIPTWADMCRWIIAHTHRHFQTTSKQVHSLLTHLLHYPDIENHPSLAFFVKLSIIKKYEYTVAHDYSQIREDVLTQLGSDPFYKGFILCTDLGDLEPYTDSRFRSTVTPRKEEICNGERGVNGSLLMLQALAANPPISNCRQILEFFYFLRFPTDSVTFLARQPLLLERLVQITQKFCVLWASSPSQDLFEVNRMLWRLWRCILSDGPWKDPNPWRELKPTQTSHSRTLQNFQRDPGPWGDPIPWTNPDPRCITKLRPLLEVAEGIISTPSETLDEAKAASGKRQQAGSFTAIDALDPVSEARIVSDHLRSLFASE